MWAAHKPRKKDQKKPNTLLTGFKAIDATAYEHRDLRSKLYCHKKLGEGVLPRCRLLDHICNEADISFDDIFYPDGWDKLPQPKSLLEAFDRQIMVLDRWVKEQVDPESPVFWFYAYSNWPCMQRVCRAEVTSDGKLIKKFNYTHPAWATKLNALWDNLAKKASEWDARARLMQESQCWIDPRPSLIDPVEVKSAAAALRNELKIISELVKEEQLEPVKRTKAWHILASIVIGLILIGIFELFVLFYPWKWLMDHPNRLGLHGCFDTLLFLIPIGVVLKWRKGWLIELVIGLILVILGLLGH